MALCSMLMEAQEIRWISKNYDFGVWKEVTGPRTGESRFVNVGKSPVTILDVKPSCGCTSASYTESPVAPGDTAIISYTYNPEGRPGRFRKTVKLRMSDGSRPVIEITGSVIGTPESLQTLYPIRAGHFYLTTLPLPEKPLPYGSIKSFFVNIYNESPDSINPVARVSDAGIRVERASGSVGPGDTATFGIYFDTAKHGEMGPVEIPIEFASGPDAAPEERTIQTLRAMIVPDASRPSADAGNKAPIIQLRPDIVDFGMVQGNPIEFEITIANEGKGPLEIFRVYPLSEAITINNMPDKGKLIKKGKNLQLECTMEFSQLPGGPFRTGIGVITNDSVTPLAEIRVVGELKK